MLNIISEINAYLKSRVTLPVIYQNVFPGTGTEELICRTEPSTAVENRYLDGTREGTLNFAYYSKSLDQVTARTMLDSIVSALDFAGVEISEGLTVNIYPVTLPAYVQKTDKGEHIFTAAFRIEYLNRRI